jgi:hypothetical protein
MAHPGALSRDNDDTRAPIQTTDGKTQGNLLPTIKIGRRVWGRGPEQVDTIQCSAVGEVHLISHKDRCIVVVVARRVPLPVLLLCRQRRRPLCENVTVSLPYVVGLWQDDGTYAFSTSPLATGWHRDIW